MNAPDPHVLPAVFPLVDLLPSPTNPRKHFDEAALAELAKSIQEHGVLQPILLRRWQHLPPRGMTIAQCCDKYEIVAGERRWRAARLAGADAVPAYVRDLDDKDVLEIQMIENLQRDDLHELEEADGYRQMIDKHGYTAETIAAKIGQSKAYVYARLKLCALIPAGRVACFDGKLSASTALLIARMPEPLQAKALKEVLEGASYGGDAMPYRAAANLLQRRFMLRLADAPFPCDDATLKVDAGPCGDCPKRTGNQPELFHDVDDNDICTDPDCFEAKKLAHARRKIEQAKADGRRVIDGAEAKKVKPHAYGDIAGDYVQLDARCYDDPKSRTYRQLLGKDAKAPEILVDPHDKSRVIEVLPRATIAEHLADKGIVIAQKAGGKSDAQKTAERKLKIERDYRGRLFDAIRSSLTLANAHATRAYTDADWRLVAHCMLDLLGFDAGKKLVRYWYGPTDDKQTDHELIGAFKDRIDTLPAPDLMRLILEATIIRETMPWSNESPAPAGMLGLAEQLGIDAPALKKAAQSDARAKEKAKAKPAAKSAAKPAKAEAQAPAATATLSPIALGQRVVIKPGATWPDGKKIKDAGVAGTVESQTSGFWNVRLDDNRLVTHLASTQLTAAETASTPESAARASGKGATKAAPADGKTPTPAAAKKPRGKTGSATAAPSNEEPTAAAEAGALNVAPAAKFADSEWPFPFPTRKS